MKFLDTIKYAASDALEQSKFTLKEYAPELLLGASFLTGAGAVITAIISTRKLDEKLEDSKEEIDVIRNCPVAEEGSREVADCDAITQKRQTLMLTRAYIKAGAVVAKLYAPTLALGAASVATSLAAHTIMTDRNLALTSACTSLANSFNMYRGNVIDRFGEEVDKQLYYGYEEKEIETTEVDTETGEVVTKKVNAKVVTDKQPVEYVRFFDESSRYYDEDYIYAEDFVRTRIGALQDRYDTQKHLFLNDALDYLGFDKIVEGQARGWINSPKDHSVYLGIEAHDVYIKNPDDPSNYIRKLQVTFTPDPGTILGKFTAAQKMK